MITLRRPTSILIALLLVTGCAAQQARVEKGSSFATAGIAYVDALPAIFDESFELTVAGNTSSLMLSREDLSEDQRMEMLSNSDDLLTDRLSLLRDLQRHSMLLRSYFISLQALLSNENATGVNAAADGVMSSLTALRPEIEDKSIAGAQVSSLVGPVVNLAVGAYQNAALKRELELRGSVIERELALQKEVINALVEDMTDNAELVMQIEQLNPIFDEYVSGSSVSADWSNRRVAAYKLTIHLSSYEDISKAAANMHSAWIALVEGSETDSSIGLLIEDIEQMLALARLFKTND